MQANASWYSAAALSWLQIILQERFGRVFSLNVEPDGVLSIALGADSKCIELTLDATTFARADSDLPCAHWDASAEGWQTALPGRLPAPGATSLPWPLVEPTSRGHRVQYDILGLAYWMLTRQEEVGRSDLDKHGRFPAEASHGMKHGYLERPIVDEWFHVLGQVITKTWPVLVLKRHMFTIKLSHDVDSPSRYGFRSWRGVARAVGGDLFRRCKPKDALLAPWIRLRSGARLHPQDPYNTFDWLMDVSERHGLVSAFYFICGRSSDSDADYEPEHPAIRNLMRRIHARGHEIGLHPSYGSYKKPEIIRAEAQRLRRITQQEGITQSQWGGRMHYLRWEHPTTLRAWADAGMDYDSTLGYADRPGFRCGTCFEYPAFDPVAGEVLSLRVRPLVVMEGTVMDPNYMGLGAGEGARTKFIQIKDATHAVGGSFSLLWHNSQFEGAAQRRLYEELLTSH